MCSVSAREKKSSRAVTILLSTRVLLSKDDRAEEMAELTWLPVW